MIQRIQSLFLFLSLCFITPMFFVPIANLVFETGEIFTFNLIGFFLTEAGITACVSNQYSLTVFGIVICALNLIIIFLYRNRILQVRFCIYNILLLIGLIGVMLFVLYSIPNVRSVAFGIPVVFPVISIILHYLAFRGIRKDELMVQALNRLR